MGPVDWMEALACPECHSALEGSREQAVCRECARTYPIRDGVLDFLGKPPPLRLATRLLHFRVVARIYEHYWRPSLCRVVTRSSFGTQAATLTAWHEPAARDVLLDVGCGTGNFTRAIARQHPSARVIGLDISSQMLGQARDLADQAGLSNLAFVRASALQLPFRTRSLTGINCCGALHLFSDMTVALAEFHRCARPNATLSGLTFTAGTGLSNLLLRHGRSLIGMHFFSEHELERALFRASFADYSDIREGLMLLFRAKQSSRA